MESEIFYALVVDDEDDLCWVIESTLRPIGFSVRRANSGEQALSYLAEKNFQVAFVDAKIVDIDGFNLAALIRQRSPATHIILISGYFYQEDKAIVKGLKNKLFSGFIAKPFDLNEVRRLALLAVGRTR